MISKGLVAGLILGGLSLVPGCAKTTLDYREEMFRERKYLEKCSLENREAWEVVYDNVVNLHYEGIDYSEDGSGSRYEVCDDGSVFLDKKIARELREKYICDSIKMVVNNR